MEKSQHGCTHQIELDHGSEIPVDSLLPGSKNGFYQGISDTYLEGVEFKMFYVPVDLYDTHFIMCGFKDARDYQESLHEVSPGFIYPIVIILLLLLIIMPLIKLNIMGADERIKVWDFTGYFSSLFVGSMFITLIIIQVIMLEDGEYRMKNNLSSISGKISVSLQQELVKAYNLLEQVDNIHEDTNGYNKLSKWPKGLTVDLSNDLINWITKNQCKDSLYYNFDKIAWIDSAGEQIIKAGIDGNRICLITCVPGSIIRILRKRTQIACRNRFRLFYHGAGFQLDRRIIPNYSRQTKQAGTRIYCFDIHAHVYIFTIDPSTGLRVCFYQ